MGTDAVSRGNLRRHMPRTFRYLKEELGAIDLHGYIKIGDNTDPNLSAVLMGMSFKEIKSHPCQPKPRYSKFDDCPLIWKDFSKRGYATAYAEDAAWMGLFHFNEVGYVKEPTDYYNRPYFLVSEAHIAHKLGFASMNAKICQGDKKSMSVIHDYSLAVADALQDLPYFGFYWATSLTHDFLQSASAADEPSLEYLQSLRAKGEFETTVHTGACIYGPIIMCTCVFTVVSYSQVRARCAMGAMEN